MYGHVEKLAEEIKKGASSVGVEAKLWQVAETLPEEVLGKMGAPPKSDVPIIMPDELAKADGIVFGFPARFWYDGCTIQSIYGFHRWALEKSAACGQACGNLLQYWCPRW